MTDHAMPDRDQEARERGHYERSVLDSHERRSFYDWHMLRLCVCGHNRYDHDRWNKDMTKIDHSGPCCHGDAEANVWCQCQGFEEGGVSCR